MLEQNSFLSKAIERLILAIVAVAAGVAITHAYRRAPLVVPVSLPASSAPAAAPNGVAATYYLSPAGDDSLGGANASHALRSFAAAVKRMKGGDRLVLLDGVYDSGLDWRGPGDGQLPSGTPERPTLLMAANAGMVRVRSLFVGRSTHKDSHLVVKDITFDQGCVVYNSGYITLKNVGCHGGLFVGTNDGEWGNTNDLFEDVWVWATGQRAIAANYRSDRNIWRRVLIRGDGCGTAECSGSGNPNVGFTIYDSSDVSVQNVMILDRVLAKSDSGYADFACAQHTPGAHLFGRNEWLGIVSLNSPDLGLYCEPDDVIPGVGSATIANSVIWNSASDAINFARTGTFTLSQVTVKSVGGDAIRLAPALSTGSVSGALVLGAGRYGINSSVAPSKSVVAAGGFNQTTCADCETVAPRLETILKSAATAGIGATIVNRYGVDGSRFAESGYDTLSNSPLWPWPNEARIKTEMCVGIKRGFCAAGSRADGGGEITITSYLWDLLAAQSKP